MAEYPNLKHISVGALIAAADGDPWQVDESIQAGDPAAISDLSRAFVAAGACTAETYGEFTRAQERFRASWNRSNGDHPINDSAEVSRATTALLVQKEHLPAIGANLAAIAAHLAEAQRFSRAQLRTLDTELRYLDALIGAALLDDEDTVAIEQAAITVTANVLHQVRALRDEYAAGLHASVTEMRYEYGYDPAALTGVDADGESGPQRRGPEATDFYDASQRAEDQRLVDEGGPTTEETLGAAARLRDYATATDPGADPDARRLAAQRLDDFRMAAFTGPLPIDPILGGDARSRARTRIDLQRRLEDGSYGLPATTPDQATENIDSAEQYARAMTIRQAVDALVHQGMSTAGAVSAVDSVANGTPLADLANVFNIYSGPIGSAAETFGNTVSTGRHSVGALSHSDAEAFSKLGRRLGNVGTLVDFALRARTIQDGAPVGRTIGGAAGSMAGGYLAGIGGWALAGSAVGPEGAAAAAFVAAIVLSGFGEELGGSVGAQFDK